jgi:hypothetical protein
VADELMAIDIDTILDGIISHALASGWFERVNVRTGEPKNAPGSGLTVAVWAQAIDPIPAASGLTSTTSRVTLQERIYSNMLQEPADMIDPNVIKATDVLCTAYSGDFTLGGSIKQVDLLGAHGVSMHTQAGYVTINQTMYRCMDITLPLIVNDLWTQAA